MADDVRQNHPLAITARETQEQAALDQFQRQQRLEDSIAFGVLIAICTVAGLLFVLMGYLLK